ICENFGEEGQEVFVPVVEPALDFLEVQGEVVLGHATVGVEPVLGVAPEPLDAVDVLTSPGTSLLLADDDVTTAKAQARIGLVLSRVVERAWGRMLLDERQERRAAAVGHGPGEHVAIPLMDARASLYKCQRRCAFLQHPSRACLACGRRTWSRRAPGLHPVA